jgi:hypothetical protein
MDFETWVSLKRNPSDKFQFLAKFSTRLAATGWELRWITPRFVQDNDGNKWVYWKAIRWGQASSASRSTDI